MTPKQAMSVLSKAMQEDIEYAWSWHCNIAMVARDAGADWLPANVETAAFMQRAFGVDTLALVKEHSAPALTSPEILKDQG